MLDKNCYFCGLVYTRVRCEHKCSTASSVLWNGKARGTFFWLFPHSLALMRIIFCTHWGRVCVGGDMSQSYYFSYSFLCSIGLEGSGRPDTVQLWAWVTISATHSVWPACSMPFSLEEVNRHPSAATSPHTHSPIFVEWSWYEVLMQWMYCFYFNKCIFRLRMDIKQ